MRTFDADLKESHSPVITSFFDANYRSQFGADINIIRNDNYNDGQKRGIDVVIYRGNDTVIRAEEKADKYPPNNFALEYVSSDRTNAPGWMEKDLACDYLVYGFYKSGVCYFLPWLQLRRAWIEHRDHWKQSYPCRARDNGTYNTLWVAVPVKVVLQSVIDAMCQRGWYLAEDQEW